MKVTISKYASYIYVREFDKKYGPLKTKDLDNGVYLDYDTKGRLVGIEILSKLDPEFIDEENEEKKNE